MEKIENYITNQEVKSIIEKCNEIQMEKIEYIKQWENAR